MKIYIYTQLFITTKDFPIVRGSGFHVSPPLSEFKTHDSHKIQVTFL